jgi:hypothetical protein
MAAEPILGRGCSPHQAEDREKSARLSAKSSLGLRRGAALGTAALGSRALTLSVSALLAGQGFLEFASDLVAGARS